MSNQANKSLPIWKNTVSQTLTRNNIKISNPSIDYLSRMINTYMYNANTSPAALIDTAWLQLQYNTPHSKTLAQFIGDQCILSVGLMPQALTHYTEKNRHYCCIGKQAYKIRAVQPRTNHQDMQMFLELSDHFAEITLALILIRKNQINHENF